MPADLRREVFGCGDDRIRFAIAGQIAAGIAIPAILDVELIVQRLVKQAQQRANLFEVFSRLVHARVKKVFSRGARLLGDDAAERVAKSLARSKLVGNGERF